MKKHKYKITYFPEASYRHPFHPGMNQTMGKRSSIIYPYPEEKDNNHPPHTGS